MTGKSDKPWTKKELSLFKNGIAALAAAVIRQWELDGCPERDEQVVKEWKGIFNAAQEK